jgi:hypothetical protein
VPNLVKISPVVLEKKILKDPTPFLHFYDYLNFKKGQALYLNKLDFPSPQDNLYQVFIEFGLLVLEKKIIKKTTLFLHFCDYVPFEEDLALYLNKFAFPLPKDNLYQV